MAGRTGMEDDDEGQSVSQAHLRQVQGHSPPRRRAGDLPEPEAQAEAGINPLRIGDCGSRIVTADCGLLMGLWIADGIVD